MKKLFYICLLVLNTNLFSQATIEAVINKYNDHSIPYIYVEDLKKTYEQALLLDVRELEEFKVSHLKNAHHIGFKNLEVSASEKLRAVLSLDKNKQIVVYCSIGVRSEIIAKKIRGLGYTNVYNLYGGLFEWVNKGGELYLANKRTQKVHAYSKKWGAYLTDGIKVYE